jgi:tetratricopeptide (TPR) repeat protein
MDYAYFLYERGEYTKALEILKNLRQINENCYEAFYHMSSIYFGIGDYEKGSNMLKKALSLAPELLHVIEDNYPELIDRIPLLKQYFPIGDSGKKN